MVDSQTITVCRADAIGGGQGPGRTIHITRPLPEWRAGDYVAQAEAFHRQQAEQIHDALSASLPGGTLDNLFALMASGRASILRVARMVDTDPIPLADDDLVDAEIVGYEAQCGTYERRIRAAVNVLMDEDLGLFTRHAIALEYLRSAL